MNSSTIFTAQLKKKRKRKGNEWGAEEKIIYRKMEKEGKEKGKRGCEKEQIIHRKKMDAAKN